VFRSNKHLYVQVVDDKQGKTLASASSLTPELKAQEGKKGGKELSQKVGTLIAARCKEKGITKVVFDRNGFIYHTNGVLAALADAARKGGLDF
jgi:large subunit ribosomal protein L18